MEINDSEKKVKLIKKFIMENFPEVYDVRFQYRKVSLASLKDKPVITSITIIPILDNSNNELEKHQRYTISKEIINTVDQVFGLDWNSYGSGWDFAVMQLAVVPHEYSTSKI